MKYTQIPEDTFQNLQLNAGILVDSFTVGTGEIGNIIGATSGGVSFTATPEYSDYGEDIDNCPKNMMELKKLDSWEAKMSGTFVSVSEDLAKLLVGAADTTSGHIVPRNDILTTDFSDIWWIGDYSDKNTGNNAGYCAIHLKNALSTTGFQIQTSDNGKGTFSFEFTGHYSMDAQDEVPLRFISKQGNKKH